MAGPHPAPRTPRSCLLYSPQFSHYLYGSSHPLKNERLALTYRLIDAYGLLNLEGSEVKVPRMAREEDLLSFHRPEYLQALRSADRGEPSLPSGYGFGLGTSDNPVFPGVYTWSLLITGASLSAAEAIEEGGFDFAFNMGGGLHHAHAARASGFCYLNDPAVMIYFLLRKGRRVAYLDLDAHHGDGVQEAFYEMREVLTISLHESGTTLFPGTGFPSERGVGEGEGFSVNLPFAAGTDDETFLWAFDQVVPPLVFAFGPDILVTQLGIDTHYTDPLANLSLTLDGFGGAIARVRRMAPKWIALGGGGYEINNVPRAWALSWAVMNDKELDPEIPEGFLEAARPFGFTAKSLWDAPPSLPRSIRESARRHAQEQVEIIQRSIFPLHGL